MSRAIDMLATMPLRWRPAPLRGQLVPLDPEIEALRARIEAAEAIGDEAEAFRLVRLVWARRRQLSGGW